MTLFLDLQVLFAPTIWILYQNIYITKKRVFPYKKLLSPSPKLVFSLLHFLKSCQALREATQRASGRAQERSVERPGLCPVWNGADGPKGPGGHRPGGFDGPQAQRGPQQPAPASDRWGSSPIDWVQSGAVFFRGAYCSRYILYTCTA